MLSSARLTHLLKGKSTETPEDESKITISERRHDRKVQPGSL